MNQENSVTAMAWQTENNSPTPSSPDSQPAPTSGGPQFGQDNNQPKGFRGWLNKYGSSVILPVVALLILAGGIYLYANQKTEQNTLLEQGTEDNISSQTQEQTEGLAGNQLTEEETNQVSAPEQTNASVSEQADDNQPIVEITPETRRESGNIIETANQGEGVTHLARRALKNYLQDNPEELTNEHKVYIEDYLKDKTGARPLEVGEEISFSETLIQEAINSAAQLNANQLKTIGQYSSQIVW